MSTPLSSRLLHVAICLLLAVAALPRVLALNPDEKPANYIVAHWDTEDGLPHNQIKQIFQTRDGYLWLGTLQGLARFDGLAFTIFNTHNTPALRSNQIVSMAETSDGSLWIGTSSGLVRYLGGQFTAYTKADGLPSDTINALCVAPDGSMWVGGRDGVARWVNGKFVHDIDTSKFDTVGMRNITVDHQGALWLAVGSGALRYQNGTFTAFGHAQGLPAQQVEIIREDAEGHVLAVTQGGLLQLVGNRFEPLAINSALSSPRISRTLVDRSGSLWVCSVEGVDRYAGGKVVPYLDRNGNKLGVVDVLFQDREGSLWLGSSTGLYRLSDRRAYSLSTDDGISGTLVLAVAQSRDGSLWTSSWGAGVVRFQNGAATHLTRGAPLSHESVTSIYEAPDGAMWFGNRGSSVDRWEGGKVTTFVYASGVATSRPVTAMLADEDGTLLLGIHNRGLLQLRDGRIAPVPEATALAQTPTTVWSLYRTAAGRLLAGTTAGLYERRGDRSWVPVAMPGLTGTVIVRSFLETDGALWLATDAHGLVRWRNGETRSFGTREGMVDDTLYSVLDDGQGALWVSSARGLARIRKTEFAAIDRGQSTTVDCLTFGRVDGLLSASSSGGGSPSAVRLADGRLLTATDKGVAVIDPRLLQVNHQSPAVVIEAVQADDQLLSPNGPINLGAGAGKLEFRYTALSLLAPQQLRFRYQLEGSDPSWVEAGHDRRARYTHLAPGRYTFHVLACNSDGVWNQAGAKLSVTVLPHYYQTLWFRLSSAALVAGLLLLAVWMRVRRLHHQRAELARINVELDQRVEERTAALRRSQEQAALEHARFKFIFDSVPVGITLASERLDGTKLRLINDAHLRICGLSREQLDEPAIFQRITHPDDYPAQELQMAALDRGEISHFSLEKRYLRADGSVTWVVMNRLRLRHDDGNRDYLTTIVDITARKQAEQELADSNRQRVELSRAAGMAEVATGVLHNVGNVLNSLNVSASVIGTGLRQSKTDSLGKIARLLADHRGDLAAFLTSDPKGSRLPELIASLARHAVEERDRLLQETTSLQQNVDHIKEIVSMQQAHATMVSMIEPLDPAALVEDALRMNSVSLARHGVRVEREFRPVSSIFAEKGKVLQILINLIRNAEQACDAGPTADKLITLTVEPGSAGGAVRLIVRDNGIGIRPENLERIFAHGFTTKAQGHGFGLHSAANAAREMKGILTAHSEGPGRGATFVLELPVASHLATESSDLVEPALSAS